MYENNWSGFWILRLFSILAGYATILAPSIVFVRYVRRTTSGFPNTFFWNFAKLFSIGRPEYELLTADVESAKNESSHIAYDSFLYDCACFVAYFIGIQITLVPMGFFQERIMTQDYVKFSDPSVYGKFNEAQFLVMMNRLVALLFSVVVLFSRWSREPVHVPALYKHSFTSMSNTLSSWCQYEALKFVSFPTQTVCKASKILPTMLMGFIVRGERYAIAQCISALFLAAGASMFFLENARNVSSESRFTTFSGLVLMAGYLFFDGFTLNWQKKLFDTRPRVSKYQMMLGVNAFSLIFCFVSLVEEGKLLSSIEFLMEYEDVGRDIFLLSLFGAFGQVVIYKTIEHFGPIVFAVVMTLRQIFSIAGSLYIYEHPVTPFGLIGLLIVFVAIFYNLYRQYKGSRLK
uniref:Adenosine 3'-phospho 5'-phosphosulfate transporter 1 n=1 Tax=Syphacia muris TaxID=451379 RepID=A0A0N5AVI4_9BILA